MIDEEKLAFVQAGFAHYGTAIRTCLRFAKTAEQDLLEIARSVPTLTGWRPTGEPWSQFTKATWQEQPWIGVGRPGVGDAATFGTEGPRSLHVGLVWWDREEAVAYLHFDPDLRRLADWTRGKPAVRPVRRTSGSWGLSYLVATPSADLHETFNGLFAALQAFLAPRS
jgi:hypothetical protein